MRLLLACLLLLLSACSAEPARPPAQALSASEEKLAQIPGIESGPYAVQFGEAQDWQVGSSALRLRVVKPSVEGLRPLLIFSHGFASDIDQYDALFEHWASHGFVIIAPFHRDGGGTVRAIFNSLRYGNMGLIDERVRDIELILNNLDGLGRLNPELPTRIDQNRIAVAGHSFGAFTAQQFGGAMAIDLDSRGRSEADSSKVRAVLAISPPGEMFGIINNQSWKSMRGPMLATTGTWDSDGRFVTDWRQHRLSFDTAQPGQNSLLVIEGADHYLGNLICRLDREEPPQQDALRILNAVSVSFLKQHLGPESEPGPPLQALELEELSGGFARLFHR